MSLQQIDPVLQLVMLLLEIVQLGLQRQQTRLHRTRGLVPVGLGKRKAPRCVFSLGGGRHHSYPWPSLWIQDSPNFQSNHEVDVKEKVTARRLGRPL